MEIVLSGRKFVLTEAIGKVADSNKTTTQQIYASGGGGGFGNTNPVTISSTTTIHDTLFLTDRDGKEFTLKLSNVDIAVRPGHELHCVWATPEGKEASLVGIYNRSTRETFWLDANLTKMFRLTRPLWRGILIVVIVSIVLGLAVAEIIPGLGGILALPLMVGLPFLFWRRDKRSTEAVTQLKSLVAQGFESRAGEGMPPVGAAS